MEKYFKVLRNCTLFADIADENLLAMMGCLDAKVAKFTKKETVIAEGEPARYIGIVLTGSVRILRVDYYGNRSIVTNAFPSELFGESFACAGVEEMPMDVVANEETEILLVDCQKLLHTCNNACEFHRQMIYNLMKVVAGKNLLLNEKIEITSKRTTREKLMTYLLLQAKKKGSKQFEIPFDLQELADYLEVERSGLSSEIGKLQKEGILRSRKSKFELL
nr:Crp/Fnr family transcriptional regulator [Eubacterium sp.]